MLIFIRVGGVNLRSDKILVCGVTQRYLGRAWIAKGFSDACFFHRFIVRGLLVMHEIKYSFSGETTGFFLEEFSKNILKLHLKRVIMIKYYNFTEINKRELSA
ncbi:hypothetical protein JOD43_000951 [Pullulanibacillus pueri]|nr:hypothetical protein [Pullulanibacillus pueri]